MPPTSNFTAPLPLFRGMVPISAASPSAAATTNSKGVPSSVHLTTWGSPLEDADHVAFYFGGMPASAEEPALHSLAADEEDSYKQRKLHLICIDKPGMGLTPFQYRFSIRQDWPQIVHGVAQHFQIEEDTKFGVFGMSNGGPYVMACLTHPLTQNRIAAASMIVGVSDVKASGYFGWKHPSGLFEGLYNSLPVAVTGPLNYLAFSAGYLALSNMSLYNKVFPDIPSLQNNVEGQRLIKQWISDGALCNAGLGSAVDCQQGLSPFYAAKSSENIAQAYANVTAPVSLWYGTKDSSVPLASADWLHERLPNSQLFHRETGHGLFFYHSKEVLDDLVEKMGQGKNQ